MKPSDDAESLRYALNLANAEKRDLYDILQLREREIQNYKNEIISIKRKLEIETKSSILQKEAFDKKTIMMQNQSEMVKGRVQQFVEIKKNLQMQLKQKEKEVDKLESALGSQIKMSNMALSQGPKRSSVFPLILRKQHISYQHSLSEMEDEIVQLYDNNDNLRQLVKFMGGVSAFCVVFGLLVVGK
ncbi:hypothetical protein SS50377_21852 [Spironucleus salmonicida]|uniref:Uncharacterized protein n=1 Tax=Spironucleus salmonicida TaxID=348837 RepID=V6LKY0_9EUKA|nr:hypothetical protein SS50377_21852 [Spironucleus salmonicida]|eukprot:EST44396.1 Hypothetical protein SS50377_15699 [Spironucleus salmonicida]